MMGLKQVGVGLLLLAVLSFGDAQRRTWKMDRGVRPQGQQTGSRKPHQGPSVTPTQAPLVTHSRSRVQVKPVVVQPNQLPQDSLNVQSHQLLQGPVKKVTWRFPEVPKLPQQPPVPFELRRPVPQNSVAAECGENMVYVEVKQDLFGTGQLLTPSALMLGGCGPSGQDVSANVLVFQYELQACNSALMMTEDELIYTFMLTYTPTVFPGTSIIRIGGAMVGIECHYARKTNVSSSALMPAWIPYAATKVAEEQLVFSLRLMTDDWKYERPSNQYFLGDVINIEASVMQFNHVPLRMFVDSCVATSVPDENAVPRYSIIENHGCLVDAKVTGSNSHFLSQDQDDKLQFQVETFRFQQDNDGNLYIMCFLKVMAASSPSDAENKACSFSTNRWTAAYGDDQVCGCCESTCGSRKGRAVSPAELQMGGHISLGPILVMDDASADVAESPA